MINVFKLKSLDVGKPVLFEFMDTQDKGIIISWDLKGIVNVKFDKNTIPIKECFLTFINPIENGNK